MPRPRKPANPFRYFHSSPEVIRLVVLMYVRFPLSLRNVEDLLFERGIDVCHETVRLWWNRFGPLFAADIRRQRGSRMRGLMGWIARARQRNPASINPDVSGRDHLDIHRCDTPDFQALHRLHGLFVLDSPRFVTSAKDGKQLRLLSMDAFPCMPRPNQLLHRPLKPRRKSACRSESLDPHERRRGFRHGDGIQHDVAEPNLSPYLNAQLPFEPVQHKPLGEGHVPYGLPEAISVWLDLGNVWRGPRRSGRLGLSAGGGGGVGGAAPPPFPRIINALGGDGAQKRTNK